MLLCTIRPIIGVIAELTRPGSDIPGMKLGGANRHPQVAAFGMRGLRQAALVELPFHNLSEAVVGEGGFGDNARLALA